MHKKARKFLSAIILLALLSGIAYGLGWSNLLAVKSVEILGTDQTELILKSVDASNSGMAVGKPLARIKLAEAQKSIESIDWIAKTSISRNWLNGRVEIKVVPRIPVAVFAGELGQLRYLDSSGFEFTALSAPANLPRINLMSSKPEVRKFAAEFVAKLPDDILRDMTSLLISSGLRASMTSQVRKPDLVIEWGSSSAMATKIELFHRLLALPENKKISLIDLSNPNSPIVK